MRLEIEVPEWVGDRTLKLIAGSNEHVATLFPDGSLWVKKERCNQCGDCCINPGPLFPSQDVHGLMYCAHCELEDGKWWCKHPTQPFGCVKDSPPRNPHPDCVQTWEKVK